MDSSGNSELSDDQKNENVELPPHWNEVLSTSNIPGKVYYFNHKNGCSVWSPWETKLKKNNIIPNNLQKGKGGPLEPEEPPGELTSNQHSNLEEKPENDETTTPAAQEAHFNSYRPTLLPPWASFATNVTPFAFTPESTPPLFNPNIWPFPPGGGQFTNPYMGNFSNNIPPNVPTFGAAPGVPGWSYQMQAPNPFFNAQNSTGPRFMVNAPNAFQFGSQANFPSNVSTGNTFTAQHAQQSSAQHPSNQKVSVPAEAPFSNRLVDGKEMQFHSKEIETQEYNNEPFEIRSQNEHYETVKKVLFADDKKESFKETQPKQLNENDLRLRIAARRKLRHTSIDENELLTSKAPVLIRKRRMSCPAEVKIISENEEITHEAEDISNISTGTSLEDDTNDVVTKGQSYGSWLLKRAKLGVSQHLCYIAIDTNVFIRDLDMVKDLISHNTDNVCRILVPWCVNNEIGHLCKSKRLPALRIRASKANMFVRNELGRQDSVMVVQSPLEASNKIIECSSPDDEIVNCCLQYAQRDLHVVLLSEDINLCTKMLSSGIEAYTIDEMKMFIEDVKERVMERERLLKVKVTVPNLPVQKVKAKTLSEVPVVPQTSFSPPGVFNDRIPIQNSQQMRGQAVVSGFQKSPPIGFSLPFNVTVPPLGHYMYPGQPMFATPGGFVSSVPGTVVNQTPMVLNTFAANMMSTLTNEDHSNKAENASLSSSKSSSTKNSSTSCKKIVKPITTAKPTENKPSERVQPKEMAKIVWEQTTKKNCEAPSNKKIKLRRTPWNSNMESCSRNPKASGLMNLPKVPVFPPEPILPVSVPQAVADSTATTVSTATTSSNYPTSTTSKCTVQPFSNRILPKELPIRSEMAAKAPFSKDMWVSKRTQQMVMKSRIEETQSNDKGYYNPWPVNVNGFEGHAPVQIQAREPVNMDTETIPEDVGEFASNRAIAKKLIERMDEWCCILVQAMEDALSCKLQQVKGQCEIRPPWTLHEAASCIMKIYRSDVGLSTAAGKVAIDVSEAIQETTRGRIHVHTICPAKVELFMRMYNNCISLLVALKNDKDITYLEEAEQSLSKLLEEIKHGEIDLQFDGLEARPDYQDGKVDSIAANDDEENENKERCDDVDEYAEIVSYLKKHYLSWATYDEIEGIEIRKNFVKRKTVKKSSKADITGSRPINGQKVNKNDAHKIIDNNVEGNKNLTINEVTMNENEDDEENRNIDVNKNVNSKEKKDEVTMNTNADEMFNAPKIIRNLSCIPEFEERYFMNSLELEKLDGEDYNEDEGYDYEGYYKEGFEDWNEKIIDNVSGQHTENYEIAQLDNGNKVKEVEAQYINETENFQLNKKKIILKERMEQNNNSNKINSENVAEKPHFIGHKTSNNKAVALAIRNCFLNLLAFSLELIKLRSEDKSFLPPNIHEGDATGLPRMRELAELLDTLINLFQGLAEGRQCDALALRWGLQRLVPQQTLPPAPVVLSACLQFRKDYIMDVVHSMTQMQLLLKKFPSYLKGCL